MIVKFNDFGIILVLTVIVTIGTSQRVRYPTYSLDRMPQTSFTCRDKILGGYYADAETQCQMFHVCVKVAGVGIQDFRFLCPNGTAFDQEAQTCADWGDIDCEQATLYYASDNFDLYRLSSGGFESKRAPLAEEDEATFHLQRAETNDAHRGTQTIVNQNSESIQYNRKTSRQKQNNLFNSNQNVNHNRNNNNNNNNNNQDQTSVTKFVNKYNQNGNDFNKVNNNNNKNNNNNNNNYEQTTAIIQKSTTNEDPSSYDQKDNNQNVDEIFKGSHSSNFFSNKYNGKEDDFDDYYQKSTKSAKSSTVAPAAVSSTVIPPAVRQRTRGRSQYQNNNGNNITPATIRSNVDYSAYQTVARQTTTTTTKPQQKSRRIIYNGNANTNPSAHTISTTASTTTTTPTTPTTFAPILNENSHYDIFKKPSYNNNNNNFNNNNNNFNNYNNNNNFEVQKEKQPAIQQTEVFTNNNNNNNNNNFRQTTTYRPTDITFAQQKSYQNEPFSRINLNTNYNNDNSFNQTKINYETKPVQTNVNARGNFDQQQNYNQYTTNLNNNNNNNRFIDSSQSISITPPPKSTTINQYDNNQNFNTNTNNYDFFKKEKTLTTSFTIQQSTTSQPSSPSHSFQTNNEQQWSKSSSQLPRGFSSSATAVTSSTPQPPSTVLLTKTYNAELNAFNRLSNANNNNNYNNNNNNNNLYYNGNNNNNNNNNNNENNTPSTIKKFSTLVPKDQINPTTFKPSNSNYQKEINDFLRRNSNKESLNVQQYTAASYLPTTSTTTTQKPASSSSSVPQSKNKFFSQKNNNFYNTENIDYGDDDGQYRPELYNTPAINRKITKITKVSTPLPTTIAAAAAAAPQSSIGFTTQNKDINSDEYEFLNTAYSQNIAASGNEFHRNNNKQKTFSPRPFSITPSTISPSYYNLPSSTALPPSTITTTTTTTKPSRAITIPTTTTTLRPKTRASTIRTTTKKPKSAISKDKDTSYDYAYYDTFNDNLNDYSEYSITEFGKTKKSSK